MSHFDQIVVGAGIIGSCTAYQLAKRGAKVLLLEKFPLPHSRGSSHGQSRIIRRAEADPFIAKLIEKTYDGWHEIEKLHGTKLLRVESGLLSFTSEENTEFMRDVIKSLEDVPEAKNYDNAEFRARYPSLMFGEEINITGCLDPTAGIVMADKALRVVQELAVKFGAKIVDGYEVEKIQTNSNMVLVTGGADQATATFTSRSIVLTPGPWASSMLQMVGVNIPLRPMKIPVYYWRKNDFIPHSFIFDGEDTHIYGLPAYEYSNLIKICVHGGPYIDPDKRDNVSTEHIKEHLQAFIRNHFPGVEPVVAVEESCIYTVTPDWKPVVDTVPGKPNVVVAVGFSGTGFKLGPVMGDMCADIAQGLKTRQEEDTIGIQRFMGKNKL